MRAADLIRFQQGMVSHAQLLSLGTSPEVIKWQLASGRWQRVYRGVYATFTGTPQREAKLWAAVLRAGQGAMLSHETAAEVHGFADRTSSRIHITVPADSHPARHQRIADVVMHRSSVSGPDRLPPWQLPRTSLADTILDLVAAARTDDDAYAWLSRVITSRLVTPEFVVEASAGRKKMPRRAWLSEALTDLADGVHFPLERRWYRDVERAHGLPRAHRQVKVKHANGTRYLDNLYEDYGVCVELDGKIAHPDEHRSRDRRRDNENVARYDTETLRYSYEDVANHPCEQAAQLAITLTRRGWPATTLKPCHPGCPVSALIKGR